MVFGVGGAPADMNATGLGCFHARLGALADEVALELGHGGKHVELEFGGGVDGSGGGVDALGRDAEAGVALQEGVDDAGEVLGGPAQAVELVG